MNEIFFSELGIPIPDVFLKPIEGTALKKIARILEEFEKECAKNRPDIILVVGDVNSTLACAIVAKKLNIKLAHVEAGLRSGDRDMPEEINRIITDSISDLFFITEPVGVDNLLTEGHKSNSIYYVGNVMIDNLIYQKNKLNKYNPSIFESNKLKTSLNHYGVLTLHRPSNVDNFEELSQIIKIINKISKSLPIIFPVHPRTSFNLKKFNIKFSPNVYLLSSLPYMEFLNIWKDSALVLTDSGGLQEETTALGVPCVTLRNNTERPITIELGTNHLAGLNQKNILKIVATILEKKEKPAIIPKYWDGKAAYRIVKVLKGLT
jgi:UDP-N-acetylglucosamine 2-epimerase (non-hydrolysing)